MPGRIRQSDIEELRSRVNIADVVGEYVTLKSAGIGSMKGLCPFHDEKSPSFHVRPQVGMYKCFGCGEGGDVFKFVQSLDGATFPETVEKLAARIGFELHYEEGNGPSQQERGQRARILAANAAAEEFYRDQLMTPAAEAARVFLGERAFDAIAAQRFGVGFAPNSFDATKQALVAKGFTEAELVAAGLLSQSNGRAYDRFRGRVMWPIRDTTGQTLGFGARKLFDDDQGPKYLNTPETPVYRKSQVLYGLDLARRDIAKGKQVVVVEGYTDVMACHLAGVTTAVATCGTAFGVDHIKAVRRLLGDSDTVALGAAGEVVFTFDPDEAGQKAASRAFAEEQRFAAQTFVATGPEGLDPCDLRISRGDDAVRRMIEARRPMFEFMIRRAIAAHDLSTVEGRVAAARAAAPVVADIRDTALRDGYTRNVAGWIGTDPADIAGFVKQAVASHRPDSGRDERPQRRQPPRDEGPPPYGEQRGTPVVVTTGGPQPGGARAAIVVESGRPVPPPIPEPAGELVTRFPGLLDLPIDPATRLDRDALIAMLQRPDLVGRELLVRASRASFANQPLAVVRDAVAVVLDSSGSGSFLEQVLAVSPDVARPLVEELGVAPMLSNETRLTTYCRDVVTRLVLRDLLRQKVELMGMLQRTDPVHEADRYREVSRSLVQVEEQRRSLIVE